MLSYSDPIKYHPLYKYIYICFGDKAISNVSEILRFKVFRPSATPMATFLGVGRTLTFFLQLTGNDFLDMLSPTLKGICEHSWFMNFGFVQIC